MMGNWIKKKRENFKLDVAAFLNRNPDYCWTQLVLWARYRKWYLIWTENWDYRHKGCTPDDTYCGKCRYQWQRKHSYKQYNDYVRGLWDRGRDIKYGGGE